MMLFITIESLAILATTAIGCVLTIFLLFFNSFWNF